MKNTIYSIIAVLFIFIIHPLCNSDTTEPVPLTEEEKADLLVLREEEKLARDVYLYIYSKYGIIIFQNISNSEQRHMDKVLALLNKYGVPDPASGTEGIFNNQTLQDLYDQLTSKADESESDALNVGATIEDLDIKDIEDFMDRTEKSDVLAAYENLQCGSRNHLRSFYAEIGLLQGTYTPQYISQAEFDSIISTANEACGNK